MILRDPSGAGSLLWFYGFLSLSSSLIFPLLIFIVSIYAFSNRTEGVFVFAKKLIEQLLIESMRSWGQILQWSLLLLVPGFIRYVQNIFVPFIVTCSQAYEKGQIDALESSKKMVKGRWLKIAGYVLLFNFFLPMLLTGALDEYRHFFSNPGLGMGISVLDSIVVLITTWIFLKLFTKLEQEVLGESHL